MAPPLPPSISAGRNADIADAMTMVRAPWRQRLSL